MRKIYNTLFLVGLFTLAANGYGYADKNPHSSYYSFVGYESITSSNGVTPLITDQGNKVIVKYTIPGVDPKDIVVKYGNNTLVVEGKKNATDEEKNKKNKNNDDAMFSSSITLSGVDPAKIEAICKNGILTITALKIAKGDMQVIMVKTV